MFVEKIVIPQKSYVLAMKSLQKQKNESSQLARREQVKLEAECKSLKNTIDGQIDLFVD